MKINHAQFKATERFCRTLVRFGIIDELYFKGMGVEYRGMLNGDRS